MEFSRKLVFAAVTKLILPGDYFSLAGFQVTTYGRFSVTPRISLVRDHPTRDPPPSASTK
jgi:hypothetical protein